MGFYYLRNDSIDLDLYDFPSVPTLFIGLATPHVFHALPVFHSEGLWHPNSRVIFCDANEHQLDHTQWMTELIGLSSVRIDYILNLFGVKVRGTSQDSDLSLAIRDGNFWKEVEPIEGGAFERNGFQLTEEKDAVLWDPGKTAGGIAKHKLTVDGDGGGSTFTAGWGRNFLESEEKFVRMQEFLSTKPVEFINADVADVFYEMLPVYRHWPIVLWIGNMFSSYFLSTSEERNSFKLDLTRRSRTKEPSCECDVRLIHDLREHVFEKNIPLFKGKSLSESYLKYRAVSGKIRHAPTLEVISDTSTVNRQSGGMSRLHSACCRKLSRVLSNPEWLTDVKSVFLNDLLSDKTDVHQVRGLFEMCARHDVLFVESDSLVEAMKETGGEPDEIIQCPNKGMMFVYRRYEDG
jgi:hypothetical protein